MDIGDMAQRGGSSSPSLWVRGDAGACVPAQPVTATLRRCSWGPAPPRALAARGTRGTHAPGQGGWGPGSVQSTQLVGHSSEPVTSLGNRRAEPPAKLGATAEPDPALSSRGMMALGRGAACHVRGTAGTCAAAQAALCKATAGHRQLVLQLGGSGDGPWLREERRRRSAEAQELSTGLRRVLLGELRQELVSPEERRELERLWVLFLSALELFLKDLRRAHHLCQLFPAQGDGAALLHTGLGGQRGGGPAQPPAAPHLEEEIEQVRATLAEMESGANIPPWTVEATQAAGTGSTTARAAQGESHPGHCCRVL